VLAITQAICAYRRHAGIDGPLFVGMDTHALSEAAFASAIEVQLLVNDPVVQSRRSTRWLRRNESARFYYHHSRKFKFRRF